MANQANIVQNGIAGPVYLVDANGNPITSANGLTVNASFSAASLAINDGTTTTQKMAVDANGNAAVKQNDVSTTGTISAAQPSINTPVSNATVALTVGQGQSTWKAQLLAGGGGFTSGTTIVADKSPDGGTTWYSASFKVSGANPNTPVSSAVGPGPLEITGTVAGATHIRVRCSVLNSTETIAVTLRGSIGVTEISVLAPLPVGSNLIGGVALVDSAGTNKAAIDAAGNQAVKGGFAEQASLSAGSLNADLVASTDVSAYKSLCIQINGSFVGTLTFQWSNDNVNFVSLSTFYGNANTQPVGSATTAGLWISSVCARYLRIRMTAYTSGTATGVLELYTSPNNPYPSINALAAQSGTWSAQLLDSAGTNKATIDGSGNIHALTPDTSATGTVTNNNDAVSIALPGGQATALAQITGTFVGTLNFEGSPDSGTTWYAVQGAVVGGSTLTTTATAPGAWRFNIAGLTNFRVRLSPVTSGTATIGLRLSAGPHNVFVSNATTLGQAVMASSAPVVLASDEIVPVKGNFTEQASLSAGSLNADLVPSTDVSAYKWLSLHITGTFTGTLTFQCSNDNANFVSVTLHRVDTANGNNDGSATGSTGTMWVGAVTFRYFRVRMTAYTSGTATGTLELFSMPATWTLSTQPAVQSGTWTTQPGNTANTTPWLVAQSNNNASVPAGAANTVVKASAGQLASIVVTTAGTGTGNVQIFDNASTNSGTVLFAFPATISVAQTYQIYGWAKIGMTAQNVANGPVFTVFYS